MSYTSKEQKEIGKIINETLKGDYGSEEIKLITKLIIDNEHLRKEVIAELEKQGLDPEGTVTAGDEKKIETAVENLAKSKEIENIITHPKARKLLGI